MKKQKAIEENLANTKGEVGCGSVYADLGFKNHEEMETKANLVIEISKLNHSPLINQGGSNSCATDLFSAFQKLLAFELPKPQSALICL